MTYPLFPPYLGGGVGEILRRPCVPISRGGWVWGYGWLGPPLTFVLSNVWVVAGVKGKPLQMTTLHLSFVLSSLSPGPFLPNLSPYPTLTVITSLLVCTLSHPYILGTPAIGWSPHPASYGSSGRMRLSRTLMTASPTKYLLQFLSLTCQVLSHLPKRFLLTTEVYYLLRLSPQSLFPTFPHRSYPFSCSGEEKEGSFCPSFCPKLTIHIYYQFKP
jgi:hypothetical protein